MPSPDKYYFAFDDIDVCTNCGEVQSRHAWDSDEEWWQCAGVDWPAWRRIRKYMDWAFAQMTLDD